MSIACVPRLDEQKAQDLILKSSAFEQKSPSSARPIFVKLRSILKTGTWAPADLSKRSEILWFDYRWVDDRGEPITDTLSGNVFVKWADGHWQIDEERTKRAMPGWPVLPSKQVMYAIE